jgi:hypothetical protein
VGDRKEARSGCASTNLVCTERDVRYFVWRVQTTINGKIRTMNRHDKSTLQFSLQIKQTNKSLLKSRYNYIESLVDGFWMNSILYYTALRKDNYCQRY